MIYKHKKIYLSIDLYIKLGIVPSRFLNGASEENRTPVSALARPRTNRCTTPANKLEGPAGFEPAIVELQSNALPAWL